MDRTERFYTIDRLLRSRRQVSLRQLMEELEVSRATVRRDLEYMRDRMAAPIVWDAALRGYCYRLEATGDDDRYALPGLWFNASEVYALLTMDHLLSSLQPGLLEPHIEPLRERIRRLLGSGEHPTQEIEKRIRILYMASRQMDTRVFASIANALLARRRLFIVHLNRRSNLHTERVVSPQRLAHYRDNWYLDCWCHLRKGLRSFAVDAIESADLKEDQPAKEVSDSRLEMVLGAGYGIFAGDKTHQAVLRFTPEAARWVASEKWHSQQESTVEPDGSYRLSVPYAKETELVMDILRHGSDVEVLSPTSLRQTVRKRLAATLKQY
ncbi:MAG TPA: YafY family transcriptional regulator [Gammaproteobacteria bacterium]|nr:YafY family transcriptional regulator [Gammaproteobacteria bacterium]PHS09336.1 MAG: transcriptional regulator [Acidithiobacillus sp.]RTZ66730.1 MAG: transcriptional regulator [Gammaproteobacteria bacterium]HAD38089.1 transcriptional regulator [Gammaproteobacteria bacterium]HBK77841.1 transcriptional regulator [Gammaproteobacteria bacterium]